MQKHLMIDFHSHILPEMDDGSKSLSMSLEMLHKMKEYGTDIVCATSHYYAYKEEAESFLARRQTAFERLSAETDSSCPAILTAAEVAFSSRLLRMPNEILDQFCYTGTRTMLLEMPFEAWTDYETDALLDLILDRKYTILLAHFERFLPFQHQEEIWNKIIHLPLYLQMNAESLLPWMGRRKLLRYYDGKLLPVLGSDAHNLSKRPPNLDAGRNILKKKCGEKLLSVIDQKGEQLLGITDENREDYR